MDPKGIIGKRILFAPLNWGLGHATRSAALIADLKEKNEITIASDGAALSWLQKEFPDLPSIELPSLNMKYSKIFGAAGGILFRIGHFIGSIKRDYAFTKGIVNQSYYDLIISDNRYGVYSEDIESILITHQLNFNTVFSSFLELPMQNLLEKFDAIWVPDDSDAFYSGMLGKPSKPLKIPIRYIGPLSRFTRNKSAIIDFKFTLIASGPEPFRSQLVDYFAANFQLLNDSCCIIGGGKVADKYSAKNVKVYSMLNSIELEDVINRSEHIICRSGYSSIMDLIAKDQKAVLIPTPNQAEQKYLAELHSKNPLFKCVLKKEDLPMVMKELL